MRVMFCVALALSVSGCATARISHEAAFTLRCPEGRVNLQQKQEGVWMATGCGRMAICTLPAVSEAEVQCSGGGESARPQG
jgi:hypothetical protein